MKPDQARMVGIGAAALVVLSAFLPWVSVQSLFGTFTQSGADGGDGLITAALAILAILVIIRGGKLLWVGLIAALAICAVGLYDMSDVKAAVDDVNSDDDSLARASIGVGLYGTVAGGVTLLAVCWMILRGRGTAGESAGTTATGVPSPEWPPPPSA